MNPMNWLNDLFSNPAIQKATLPAIWETLQMVGISGLVTVVLGLPLGVVLFVTQPGGMTENSVINRGLGAIVNITRSFPFAILMISIGPLTQFLVGTKIGPVAASVSLAIAATPFFARLVETALRDVHSGKLDAAHAMGSTRMQSITKVLIPEALPTIVAAITTTVVTLVGYSAMAGLIGGGGLGRLAFNYGYQRYQPEVMFFLVIILILIVQLIQWIGDAISRAVDHR
ncbi:methionine ABC transporter permease [Tessaracoccus caeni]|uniref:methionine ABC transporter permease n=1 Tax=Tessaracoccus caeni TaxID=3031239 RepID=UPI0023DA5FBA|nr:methionine ABC transporter permease [Tessaracoccus caeni]MDF1487541.1 ABC transporter permease [Tessaracoccus caeni]